ncbi:hypothetical protein E3N88_13757 [Mikania micrantha]|uniref:Uncharacterized protein n=1 Tax=Mikania micrantha TaxID=192012 RepID=A0A5N6P0Q1_9ASTR|nr:hypothetical protein E3N88_13757 [Mikania micrantha]
MCMMELRGKSASDEGEAMGEREWRWTGKEMKEERTPRPSHFISIFSPQKFKSSGSITDCVHAVDSDESTPPTSVVVLVATKKCH